MIFRTTFRMVPDCQSSLMIISPPSRCSRVEVFGQSRNLPFATSAISRRCGFERE